MHDLHNKSCVFVFFVLIFKELLIDMFQVALSCVSFDCANNCDIGLVLH